MNWMRKSTLLGTICLLLICAVTPAVAEDTATNASLPVEGSLWQDIEIEEISEEDWLAATAESAEPAAQDLDDADIEGDTYDAVQRTGVYYDYLSANQKLVYDAILTVVSDVESCRIATLDPARQLTRDDLQQGLNAMQYDHPEIFWTGGSLGAHSVSGTAYYDGVSLSKTKVMTHDKSELTSMRRSYEAAAQTILKAATLTGNEGQIALSLHDALAEAVTYDYVGLNDGTYLPHTAYNAFVEGKAVCDGYAKAYIYLLNKCGITATMVTNPSASFRHGWNVVKLDGSWYETDVTWDDTGDVLSHTLFDLTRNQMTLNHGGRDRGTAGVTPLLPTATGTLYTYNYLLAQPSPAPGYGTGVNGFVTRLYRVCLERAPDASGLKDWTGRLQSHGSSGTEVAYGFIFSDEFKQYNYCNTDYVKQLYRAFMGRDYDEAGLKNWVGQLDRGTTREEVFNGFAQSLEFKRLCSTYGITQGEGIELPQYGTIATGPCALCGQVDGVAAFVTQLYDVCLDRLPDDAGLADWTKQLQEHTRTGREVAYGFVFSSEFTGKNYSDAEYVEHLYRCFLGREPDAAGQNDWVGRLHAGKTRTEVLDGFAGSEEFAGICSKYGINRG